MIELWGWCPEGRQFCHDILLLLLFITLSQTPNQILILLLSLSSGRPLRMDRTNQYNRVSEFIWRGLVAQWLEHLPC